MLPEDFKRIRNEIPLSHNILDRHPYPAPTAPSPFEALMQDFDFYDGDSGFSDLRNTILDAIECLSEKDQYCIQAIFTERISYQELGERLGYKPQKGGSPQAYHATQRALNRLKEKLVTNPTIIEWLEGTGFYD